MAQKTNSNSGDAFEKLEQLDLQESLGKAEAFFQANKKVISYAGGGLLALILGAYYVWGIYLPDRQREAVDLMHVAERYFENDSLRLAVEGDGNFPGFEEIVDEYGWTRAGNLAKYYLGVSYLRMGKYNEAIDALNSFSTKDPVLGSIALGCVGDAHLQLKKDQEALDYYLKAADFKATNSQPHSTYRELVKSPKSLATKTRQRSVTKKFNGNIPNPPRVRVLTVTSRGSN